MHELSIALGMLDLAEEEASRRSARVVAIHVKVGPLSGVVKEALESAYELAREGALLASAALVIEEVPLVVHCPSCAVDRTLDTVQPLCCSMCGAATNDIVSSRELEVSAVEIES